MNVTETVVEGTIQPDGTLVLDEPTRLPAGRVQVIVQALPELPRRSILGHDEIHLGRTEGTGSHSAQCRGSRGGTEGNERELGGKTTGD
jgi:hypothetical protein